MMGNGFGGFGMGVGWLFWLVLIGIVVAVVMMRSGGSDRRSQNVRELLEQRYARGEIGRDEYLQKKADLEHP